MNHDSPNGTTEQAKEVPAGLKKILEKDRLEATPEDIEEFTQLSTGETGVEELSQAVEDFKGQYLKTIAELNGPSTDHNVQGPGTKYDELLNKSKKLIHKIAVGEAAIDTKRAEPKGTRGDETNLRTQLKGAERWVGQSQSGQETDQAQKEVRDTKAKIALNKQKLEAKMNVMDPVDRQRLSELDQQDETLEAQKEDLYSRRSKEDQNRPDLRTAYEEARNKLDAEHRPIQEEKGTLEQKYNL